jgi:hypothetical protein
MQKHLMRLLLVLLPGPALADLCADHGRFTWPASAGNFSVTGSSCTPKVVLFFWNNRNEDGVGGSYDFGFGVGVSSTSRAAVFSRSSDGTLNADGGHRNNRVVVSLANTGADAATGDLVSLNNDGFTINAVNVSGSIIPNVRWLTIGGDDLTNVSLVQYQAATSTGNQALTGAGFQPDAVIVFTNGITLAPPDNISDGDTFTGVGFAERANGAQVSYGVSVTHTVNTESRAQSTTNVVSLPTTGGNLLWQGAVSSWDTDGITINWSTVQGTEIYFWVLYLKGPKFAIFTKTQPSASGSDSVSGLSFQPIAGLFGSFCAAASTSSVADGNWVMGAAVSTDKQSYSWASMRSGSNNSSRAAGTAPTNPYFLRCYTENSSTPTLRVSAGFDQWTSDGMNFTWTVAEATARQIFGFLIGPVPSAPGGRLTNPLLIGD